MSQNKILKDIAIKLGATVGEHVNDTNELLTAIAVALGATPSKKYNNVKDTLELIRDNISEGGSGESALKKLLDNTKSCYYLFYRYKGDDVGELIKYNDTEKVTNFMNMYSECTSATSFPELNMSNGTQFNNMYEYCQSATSFPVINMNSNKPVAATGMFKDCVSAKKIEFSHFNVIASSSEYMFYNCHALKALIIRSFGDNYTLRSTSFRGCNRISGGIDEQYNPEGVQDGYVYVPRDMIETLSIPGNWWPPKSQLRVLEDYTKDGTCWGEFDDAKAGL